MAVAAVRCADTKSTVIKVAMVRTVIAGTAETDHPALRLSVRVLVHVVVQAAATTASALAAARSFVDSAPLGRTNVLGVRGVFETSLVCELVHVEAVHDRLARIEQLDGVATNIIGGKCARVLACAQVSLRLGNFSSGLVDAACHLCYLWLILGTQQAGRGTWKKTYSDLGRACSARGASRGALTNDKVLPMKLFPLSLIGMMTQPEFSPVKQTSIRLAA